MINKLRAGSAILLVCAYAFGMCERAAACVQTGKPQEFFLLGVAISMALVNSAFLPWELLKSK